MNGEATDTSSGSMRESHRPFLENEGGGGVPRVRLLTFVVSVCSHTLLRCTVSACSLRLYVASERMLTAWSGTVCAHVTLYVTL